MNKKTLIKKMVDKFLCWKLPEHFSPDAGISFEPEYNKEYMARQGRPPMRHEPIGTNLFHPGQAKEMFEACAGELLDELTARISELERRNAELLAQIEIAQKIGDEIGIIGMIASPAWAGQMKQLIRPEMLEAEIVKRLGEPVGYFEVYNGDSYIQLKPEYADDGSVKLYRLPEPLATPEEQGRQDLK